jgi:hypothetical protein
MTNKVLDISTWEISHPCLSFQREIASQFVDSDVDVSNVFLSNVTEGTLKMYLLFLGGTIFGVSSMCQP